MTPITARLQQDQVLGAASLIMWSITLLVLVKYVLIVMFASDHGEGERTHAFSILWRLMAMSASCLGQGMDHEHGCPCKAAIALLHMHETRSCQPDQQKS